MLKIRKDGNDIMKENEHKEEIHIFHKSMDLPISSVINNNDNNNNNNNNNNRRGSSRSKKMETTVYQSNIRKKYELSLLSPWTC